MGFLVAVVCFGFIIKMLLSLDMNWVTVFEHKKSINILAVLCILGTGTLYLVAYAWSLILKFIEYVPIKNNILAGIYIKANIAKYLPGNFMNLVGRNVLAGKLGFKQSNIAISTVIEIGLFAVTTMGLAILFSLNQIAQLYQAFKLYGNGKILILAAVLLFTGFVVGVYMVMKNKKYLRKMEKYLSFDFARIGIRAIALYSSYFIFSGFTLVVILNEILGVNINCSMGFQIIGIYIVSYFIGYVTPGAPGGMGVREAVLIMFLAKYVGSDVAIVASVVHRIVTIFADITIFVVTYFLTLRNKENIY